MARCNCACGLCDRLIISTAVTFANGALAINLPEANYGNGCRYCIVVAQAIPDTATITAPVFVTIGADATQYPLQRCDCAQATACQIRTRTKYPVMVLTNSTAGIFRLLAKLPCTQNNVLASLPAPAVAGDGA